MTPAVFTHSEIHGSKDMCSYPWLIAAYHVLHRLLMPRHSPCALYSLTIYRISLLVILYELCRLLLKKFTFHLAKIVFTQIKVFSLLLPSHNCIIIKNNVQFSRYSANHKIGFERLVFKRSNLISFTLWWR